MTRGVQVPKPPGAANGGPDWQHVIADSELRGGPLPAGRDWDSQTLHWWDNVRRHPVAKTYDDVEWANAVELAGLKADLVAAPTAGLASEVRRRADDLGLTAAGRLRLRINIVGPDLGTTTSKPEPDVVAGAAAPVYTRDLYRERLRQIGG